MDSLRIVIIGGGIAGLTTAYELQERARAAAVPVQVSLVEAERRLGGVIRTERVDGFVIEGGPDSVLAQKPWAVDLAQRLGLGDQIVAANPAHKKTFVLYRGRLHELPEGLTLMIPTRLKPLLQTGLLSPLGKARAALDLIQRPREREGDVTLGAFVREHLGREAFERIVEPLMAGIYAGDGEQLSLRATFPRLLELEREYGSLIRGLLARGSALASPLAEKGSEENEGLRRWSGFVTLRQGLGQLVEALVARLAPVQLYTGQRVHCLHPRTSDGRRWSGYDVELADGRTLPADAVVLATPAYVAADIIADLAPGLAHILRAIPYVSTATVSLAFRRADVRHPLDGYGFVVPRVERRPLLACTWTSSKFPCRAPSGFVLLRCFLGRAGQEEIVGLDDQALLRLIRAELADLLGIQAEPALVRIFRWPRAMPQYVLGHLERLEALQAHLARLPGLYLTGSAYGGVGLPDGVRAGMQTAAAVLGALSPLPAAPLGERR
jgi:oxygen-dependent protoporphyrinogen oxidase